MAGVRIDWGSDWKGQQNRKLAKLFDAVSPPSHTRCHESTTSPQVEEAEPSLRCFQNQWAVEYLAKEVFTNRKTYTSCRDNPTTYRGRRRRRETHSRSPDEPNPSDESRSHSPNEPNLSNEHNESRPRPDNRGSYNPSASPFTGSLPALSEVSGDSGDDDE